MTNPNDPAFPIASNSGVRCFLTKREEFAKAAMIGLLADGNYTTESIARNAVMLADALIAELAKEKKV